MADAAELAAATAVDGVDRWALVLNDRGAQRAIEAGMNRLQFVVSVSDTHSQPQRRAHARRRARRDGSDHASRCPTTPRLEVTLGHRVRLPVRGTGSARGRSRRRRAVARRRRGRRLAGRHHRHRHPVRRRTAARCARRLAWPATGRSARTCTTPAASASPTLSPRSTPVRPASTARSVASAAARSRRVPAATSRSKTSCTCSRRSGVDTGIDLDALIDVAAAGVCVSSAATSRATSARPVAASSPLEGCTVSPRSPETTAVGSAQAYAELRAAIVENRYPPGHRLVEQRIAEELGLSRTPVREALRMLEAEGLVVSERNRGAMVRPLSPTEVVDLYGLRIRLESYAVEVATERATEAELGELVDAADAFSAVRRVGRRRQHRRRAPAPRGQPALPRRHPGRGPPSPAGGDAGPHRRHPAGVPGVPLVRRRQSRAVRHLPPPDRRGDVPPRRRAGGGADGRAHRAGPRRVLDEIVRTEHDRRIDTRAPQAVPRPVRRDRAGRRRRASTVATRPR